MDRRKRGLGQKRIDCTAAILVDRRAVVVASIADVETGKFSRRNSPTTTEKTVRRVVK